MAKDKVIRKKIDGFLYYDITNKGHIISTKGKLKLIKPTKDGMVKIVQIKGVRIWIGVMALMKQYFPDEWKQLKIDRYKDRLEKELLNQ